MTLTPLQALLAHASPTAPFDEFARHIASGAWTLDGDVEGEGLLSSALEHAGRDSDASMVPLVAAMIAAGARLPPAPPEGSTYHTFQRWRNHLPMCNLLINMARNQVPTQQACQLLQVIGTLSAGNDRTVKQMASDARQKVAALSADNPAAFWEEPVMGLSTLAFTATMTMTSPPHGVYAANKQLDARRASAMAHCVIEHFDANTSQLEALLCRLVVDASRPRSTGTPTRKDLDRLAWNFLVQPDAQARNQWLDDIVRQIQALPPYAHAAATCAIFDALSSQVGHDPLAQDLFHALIPELASLKKQDTSSMATEQFTLATMVRLKILATRIDPCLDIDAAMHAWIAMSKVSMPPGDRRQFSARMLKALSTHQPQESLLRRALSDAEFVDDLEPPALACLQALQSSMALQATSKPGARAARTARL